jgi:ribose transport system substrate-binding protein
MNLCVAYASKLQHTPMRLLPLLLLALLCACSKKDAPTETSQAASEAPLKIAVIPKGTTHEFWKAVHAGAVKAGREQHVEVLWKGPLKEDDLKGQIELVQTFTAQGVSGIALAPVNDSALATSVKSAAASGVDVVIFDSGIKGNAHKSFVATDNLAAGRLAGEAMARALGDKGNVMVLRYQEGSDSTRKREDGFLEAVRAHPGIVVKSDNQYGGATTESALSASESLLLSLGAAEGGLDGIFCPNESTTFGMLLALEKAGLAGKMHFIGFDSSDKLNAALEKGSISGLVLQDPFNIGYLAVTTLVKALRGQKVEPRIDTGSTLVTHDNMHQPEVDRLLHPKIDEWLKVK